MPGFEELRKAAAAPGIAEEKSRDLNGDFRGDLERLLNRNSRENGSDTPDFVLAAYLQDALNAFDQGVRRREEWYGRDRLAIPLTQLTRPIVAAE